MKIHADKQKLRELTLANRPALQGKLNESLQAKETLILDGTMDLNEEMRGQGKWEIYR